jgi:hypothetical protein
MNAISTIGGYGPRMATSRGKITQKLKNYITMAKSSAAACADVLSTIGVSY